MGIGDWISRLFRRAPKGDPCTLCHCAIPPSHFDKGLAVMIARQKYCQGCVVEITRRARQPGWGYAADHGSSSTILMR